MPYENIDINNLNAIKLNSGSSCSNCKLMMLPDNSRVIKIYPQDSSYLVKLKTLNLIIKNNYITSMEEIVTPIALGTYNDEILGPITNYIPNIELKSLYNLPKYPQDKIIDYLYQVGSILKKIEILNKTKKVKNFYLNDIHENNFVLNKQTGKINFLDLDGIKIGNNIPAISKYLTCYSHANLCKKYKKCKDRKTPAFIEPSINSDLYCYIIMIMNYLYKSEVQYMQIGEYNDYLSYLVSIGFEKELVDMFYKIYQEEDNINPYEMLEMIPNDIEKASYKYYLKANR